MLGKTKKNLALKITLGLVLALPVGTALAADTATIVDYDALTVKPNAEFIYHGEGDKKADFTAADIKRSETQCVYGIFVGDKAVLNAASENITYRLLIRKVKQEQYMRGLSLIKTSML